MASVIFAISLLSSKVAIMQNKDSALLGVSVIDHKGLVAAVTNFISKLSPSLLDILSRYQSGELRVNIPVIISNHAYLERIAGNLDFEFVYLTANSWQYSKKKYRLYCFS